MSHLEKHKSSTTLLVKPCAYGPKKEILCMKSQKVVIEDTLSNTKIMNDHHTYTPESPQRNKPTTSKGRSNSSKPSSPNTKCSQTLVQESTSREKTLKPFWTKSCLEMSKKLWLPIKTDLPGFASHFSNTSLEDLELRSSSPLIGKQLKKKSYQKILCRLSQSFQQDIMVPESTIYSRKIRIYPNKAQKDLFKKCFNVSRYFYNEGVRCINDSYQKKLSEYRNSETCINCHEPKVDDSFFCKKHRKCKVKWDIPLTLPKLRPLVMKSDKDLNESELWQKEVPYDTRQLILKDVITAFKACLTNKKNGTIGRFKVDFKSKRSPRQIFHVDKNAVSGMRLFKRRLKKDARLKTRKRYLDYIDHTFEKDCLIIQDYENYYLIIPKERKNKEKVEAKKGIVSLDPGVRAFQTFYSPDGYIGKAGTKLRERLRKMKEKISNLQSLMASAKSRTKYHMKRRCNTLRTKMSNTLSDFHWKLSSFLVNNFNVIIIPKFDTSDMVTKKNRNIGKETVKDMLNLAHYKFKSKLDYKCREHGRVLKVVSEEYTSKTCTSCGWIDKNLKGKKVFKCTQCSTSIDRDVNGARNILLKTLGEITTH